MNSFLMLQQEDENTFVREYQDDVRLKVAARLKTINFISSVAEHFLPRLSDTLTIMMGGDLIDFEEDYLTVKETDFPLRPSPPAPGEDGLDEIIR